MSKQGGEVTSAARAGRTDHSAATELGVATA